MQIYTERKTLGISLCVVMSWHDVMYVWQTKHRHTWDGAQWEISRPFLMKWVQRLEVKMLQGSISTAFCSVHWDYSVQIWWVRRQHGWILDGCAAIFYELQASEKCSTRVQYPAILPSQTSNNRFIILLWFSKIDSYGTCTVLRLLLHAYLISFRLLACF